MEILNSMVKKENDLSFVAFLEDIFWNPFFYTLFIFFLTFILGYTVYTVTLNNPVCELKLLCLSPIGFLIGCVYIYWAVMQ
jgi:hypothetical protein